MKKNFIRKKEDFLCEWCGHFVLGDGYTNHCSKCLYSKHVDNTPGDRENLCCGLMKPTEIKQKSGEFVLTHTCISCGIKKNNKLAKEDNEEIVFSVIN